MASCHPDRRHDARGLCGSCYQKEFTNKRPVRVKKRFLSSRRHNLKRCFGITPEQWDMMYDRQAGICPLCQKKLYKYDDAETAAAVDHCHETGKVRGLVCWTCNIQLISYHTVETAKRLVAYLESDFDVRYYTPEAKQHAEQG